MRGLWRVITVATICLVLVQGGALRAQGSGAEKPAYLDPTVPPDQRAQDLVRRMTLEEKASQAVHLAAAIDRLKVPAYNWWTEALHGVASGVATVFPEPIGLGATFDAPLIHEMATVISTEARAKHNEDIRRGNFQGVGLDFWSPNLNIFRDPRWGRGQETYGEDPYLTGRMGVAYVTGMQGDDPKYLRVISTPKHYAVHSGPEPSRHTIDVPISKHDELDTYLPAFRAAVTEGKAGSVMCVYNSVNGEPGCANSFLLEDQLRDKWKFGGYVVSDCDAVADVYRGHHYTKNLDEAFAISMIRGTDLDCNDPGNDASHYVNAVKEGLLPERDLDRAVIRLMTARIRLGMFDPPELVKYAQTPMSENDSEEHRALALKAARETMVLLKNDGVLPLAKGGKRIAVVGPLADQIAVLEGNYNGTPSRATTVLDGMKKQFPGAEISFAAGTKFLREANVAVPAGAFSSKDGRPGLDAEYFKGVELQGKPVLTRLDKSVNFNFEGNAPSLEVGTKEFSARWTGFLTVPASGTYEVGASGDDGYRLWIDGKLVVEDWGKHAVTTNLKPLELKAGQKYAVKLEYFQGSGGAVARLVWTPPSKATPPLEAAVENAKSADVVVAVVGITSSLEGEEMDVKLPGFKGGDRTSMDLPAEEEELLKAMKATGKPLVVVLMNGSALSVNWANENANAILEGWYSGEEGGMAIAETLSGANNPAGRLPVTFYKGVEQLPEFTDYAMRDRTYRYFGGQPLYPFGYGLSYSKFSYGNLRLSASQVYAGDELMVDADVTNASATAGDEVVELYLQFPALPGAPTRALRGFSRVHLAGGVTKPVHFVLSERDLSMVDPSGEPVVAAGSYRVSVGGGQPGTNGGAVEADFAIVGEKLLPE